MNRPVTLPGCFEIKDENGEEAYVTLVSVLRDPELLGRVLAQLKHDAEGLEAAAENKRAVAMLLKQQADKQKQ